MGFVMECVECESVAQRLEREGPLPLVDAIRVLRSVAEALNQLHWAGTLYRDLKPQNIMLGAGEGAGVELLDVGVAHERARGTLAYMSPEQLLGDAIGPASDIFSLGAVCATSGVANLDLVSPGG